VQLNYQNISCRFYGHKRYSYFFRKIAFQSFILEYHFLPSSQIIENFYPQRPKFLLEFLRIPRTFRLQILYFSVNLSFIHTQLIYLLVELFNVIVRVLVILSRFCSYFFSKLNITREKQSIFAICSTNAFTKLEENF